MARISEIFMYGDKQDLTVEHLLVLLERAYTDLAIAINSKPDLFERTTDGQTTDTFLAQGSININTTTNKVEMLTNHVSPVLVTWVKLSP